MEAAQEALKQRVAFLEKQFERALDDKAQLDAKHRAEAADVRAQKAAAIKERDEWKARCEQTRGDDQQRREVEWLRDRHRDLKAEVKLTEAIWEKRERLAHQTASMLAHQHSEDVRLAELNRKIAAQKAQSMSALEDNYNQLFRSHHNLKATVDRLSSAPSAKELQALAREVETLRFQLSRAENNSQAFEQENGRLKAEVNRLQTQLANTELNAAASSENYRQMHAAWSQSRAATERVRSELMASRGEKQLLERSLGEMKSKAAKTAEKRREDGRNVQSQATTVASQKAVIVRLCEQIATLSGRAVEPDLSALATTGQSKRARTASVSDVSSARISPVSPPPPNAPATATPDRAPSQTPSKRSAPRAQPADSGDDDDDDDSSDDEPYTFGKRQRRTVSSSSKTSTATAASTSTSADDESSASVMDFTLEGSLSPVSSKESTPRPRSIPPESAPGAADAGPSSTAAAPREARPIAGTPRRPPTSSTTLRSSPQHASHAGIDIQGLELSDSDDEIVVTGEKIVAPIKPLPRRKGPPQSVPPFPMKFSASQFSSSQR